MRLRCLGLALLAFGSFASAQFNLPGGGGIPGLDGIFKKPAAISTSIKDAKYAAPEKDGFNPPISDLFTLARTPSHGFILKAGGWGATLQSYCLHAGTHGPSDGDGYLYGPVKGALDKMIMAVSRNSNDHMDIPQRDVQWLIWAMLARTKISDMNPQMQRVAATLLTPQQILDLNGGALGLLSDDRIGGAFIQQPPLVRQVMEAEARLRNAMVAPGTTYEDIERIAVLGGDVGRGPGSIDCPSGRWSLHPDGYYVRYVPSGYSRTRLEIWVPEGSKAIGKEFDPATHIAVPADTHRQRLLQSARLYPL